MPLIHYTQNIDLGPGKITNRFQMVPSAQVGSDVTPEELPETPAKKPETPAKPETSKKLSPAQNYPEEGSIIRDSKKVTYQGPQGIKIQLLTEL